MDSLREILARVTREGAFGDVEFDSLIEDRGAKKGPQFMSTVMFVTIRVKDAGGNVKDLPLVIKLQPDSELARAATKSDSMFANEVCMYKTIIPELGAEGCDAFPKCYYSQSEGGDNFKNDIVVLQDLKVEGFEQPKHKIFLDLPHLLLALKKIGEFHGLSYKFKRIKKNADILKNKLIPTKYSKSWLALIKPYLVFTTRKYGKALVEQGYDKAQFDKLEQKYENIEECFKFITQPEEPYAVICHGDFNRNNFLYKYNSDGHPTDVKFFDLQNSVYSDPALDLCFFLYMNTTQATRQSHWTDLLNAYWDGILATAPQPGFTRFEFFANFEKKAFVGFVEPMFFIPVMMGDMESGELGKYLEEPIEVQLAVIDKFGGTEAFDVVRDILKHLVDNKAVQNMINL